MNERILVPLDGSALAKQALPYAQEVTATGGELVLFHAVEELGDVRDPRGQVGRPGEATDRQRIEASKQHLTMLADGLRKASPGLDVSVTVAIGDPAEQILRVAGETNVGMIVIASHGRGALGRWTYGSVADRISRQAPVPVMIVRPREDEKSIGEVAVHRLLVPLDGSVFAEQALPVAAELAKRLQVPIQLIRAIEPTREIAMATAPAAPISADLYTELRREAVTDAQQSLDRAAATLADSGATITSRVLDGPATGAILDAAKPGDLIVLASHGRSGIKRWVLGSVAEKLVRLAPVPVVLVPSKRSE